jgi:hypothetical protein
MGGGGRGRSFPPRLPPLIDGPVDSGSASSGTNSWAVFRGGGPGAWGAWVLGCGSLWGVLFPPLLPWPCAGPVFFPALGRSAKYLITRSQAFLLTFCTRVRRHGAQTIVLKRLSHGIHFWLAPLAAAKDTGSRQ